MSERDERRRPEEAREATTPLADPATAQPGAARPGGAAQRIVAGLRGGATALAERVGRRRLLAIALLVVVLVSPWWPLTIVALAAFAVATFADPGFTTALLPLAIPFAYQPKQFPSPFSANGELLFPAVELLLLLALATSGVRVIRHWRAEARRGLGTAALLDLWDEARRALGTPFGLQAGAFIALGAFSLLTVADRAHLPESLREYRTVVIEPALYFFLARFWLRDRELRAYALASFLGGATAIGLLAIGQVVTGQGVVAVEGVRRALGTYRHPNALALYLLRAAAFALAFLALAPAPRRERWLIGAAPILVIALVLTFSRGALLGLGVGIVLLGIAIGLRRAAPGLLAAAILGVALLALAATGLTIFRDGGGSLDLRRMIWASTLAMLRDHPAFGVGLDQFLTQYAPRYIDPAAWGERFTSHPHNLFLDFWVRLGIMGLAWIAWTLSSLGRDIARAWQAATGEPRRLLVAVAVACAAALTHGLVDNFYFLIDLAFIWWLLLALANIATEERAATEPAIAETRHEDEGKRRGRRRGRGRREMPAGEDANAEATAGRRPAPATPAEG